MLGSPTAGAPQAADALAPQTPDHTDAPPPSALDHPSAPAEASAADGGAHGAPSDAHHSTSSDHSQGVHDEAEWTCAPCPHVRGPVFAPCLCCSVSLPATSQLILFATPLVAATCHLPGSPLPRRGQTIRRGELLGQPRRQEQLPVLPLQTRGARRRQAKIRTAEVSAGGYAVTLTRHLPSLSTRRRSALPRRLTKMGSCRATVVLAILERSARFDRPCPATSRRYAGQPAKTV